MARLSFPFPKVPGMRSGCNAMFTPTGCFHDSAERNGPPTASRRVAGERPYGDCRNPISCLMMSASSRGTRYFSVDLDLQCGLEFCLLKLLFDRLLFYSIVLSHNNINNVDLIITLAATRWLSSRT